MRPTVTARAGSVTIWGAGRSVNLHTQQQIKAFATGIRHALAAPSMMAYLWPGWTREELLDLLAQVEEAYEAVLE